MKPFRLVTGWLSAAWMTVVLLQAAPAFGQWDQPAEDLAGQIAGVLGPGQTTLTLRNLSSIADSEVPAIRASLEKDLRAHGISIASGDAGSSIRVTLSQNERERLWVAEIGEGPQTRVVMVSMADSGAAQTSGVENYMTLRRERLPIRPLTGMLRDEPVLSAFENQDTFVILRPGTIETFRFIDGGWIEGDAFDLSPHRLLSRDPRGVLLVAPDRNGFTAFTAGNQCNGTFAPPASASADASKGWTIHCQASDEPWPILQLDESARHVSLKAFYNSARDYFTGVVSPSVGIDLPPFYAAASLERATGSTLLIGGIDGQVRLVENGVLKPVSGARDWGSDFAILKSGCGSGTQVIASGSGEAADDSLRAYELPAQEAVPASAPLAMNGSVTAMWPVADGRNLLVAVREASGNYEVDRVSALCN